MQLLEMRLAIDRLLKYERQGSTVSPSDFNRFLKQAAMEEYVSLKQAAEVNSGVTLSLQPFVREELLTHSYGQVQLPAELSKILSVSYIYNGRYVSVDFVSEMEYESMMSSSVLKASHKHPVYRLRGNKIVISPTPIGSSITITYIANFTTPYLDYYINTEEKIVYLEEGESVAEAEIDPHFVQYGANGHPLQIVGGEYVSQTKELEFNDESQVRIFHKLLTYCGITVPDEKVINNEEGSNN